MDIIEALHVMGTDHLLLMAYGVVRDPSHLDIDGQITNYAGRWLFEHESWEVSLCLQDHEVPATSFRPTDIVVAMEAMRTLTGANVCFCMFDGAFAGIDRLFIDDADAVYAYMKGTEVNVAMDETIRTSAAWSNAVAQLRLEW